MSFIENSYSMIFRKMLWAINPIKKKIIKTECEVHKFINNQSLDILKNDKYLLAYNFLSSYIEDINKGVVWADQDFKSSNHFYNPDEEKGLYGCSNAKKECINYYTKALSKYNSGDIKKAMFYFGAACHLVQDMTVPQHVNVKLLNHHRKYELWVIKAYKHHEAFKVINDGIYLESIPQYIDLNSKKAIEAYGKNAAEKNIHTRFYNITLATLSQAQKTTAGMFLKFYKDIKK
ncbi:zinc dependent phospholipase C family protein [Fervidicella metallireducens]|uniref:zinc dependent phospholipase C family protein n=1 Tax=Fervidicella metallireducens TaxID=655338 RepID=UPI00055595D1|nr:zinc dependent phospholipase C family protein [Fervidicella metallireducens]